VTRTDDLPPFETRLLAELNDVVARRASGTEAAITPAGSTRARALSPARARRFAAAAAVAALALGLAVVPGLTRGAGTPAYAVRVLEDGVLEVRYGSQLRDGRALEAELRDHGVDVRISPVPASPSAVGAVYATSGPDRPEPGFTWGPEGSGVAFIIDPARYRGRLTLDLAVAPEGGQPYTIAEEVFEPGEVLGGLHCHLGTPVQARDLVPYLEELGLDARWEIIGPSSDGDPSSAASQQVDEVPAGRVMFGYAVDASTVRFEVELPDAPLDPAHWQPRLSDLPCTAEQADAWR
jgi:hypothetical protein